MKPFRDFILCQIIEPDSGGLTVAKDVEDSQQEGVVIESGPGRYEYGVLVVNEVEPGQTIRWAKFAESGQIFERDGKKLALIRASQVLSTEDK